MKALGPRVIDTVWAAVAGLVPRPPVYRFSNGRVGLRRARPDRWGVLALTTTGRRSGRQRRVMLGYLDDGANVMAGLGDERLGGR